MAPVAGGLPEFLLGQDRAGDFLVAVLVVNLAPVSEQSVEQPPSTWHPVRHAGCGGIKIEELELLADDLVIVLLRLADEVLVRLQLFLVRECIRIDTGHLVAVLIASPVRTGDAAQLERSGKQLLRIVNVRPAAEVDIVVTGVINGDGLVLRHLLDELGLEPLIFEDIQRLLSGDFPAGPVLLTLQNLPHFVFNGFEIGLLNRLPLGKDKIIVESVLNLRPDRVLGIAAVQLKHCLGEDMSQRMTIYL